MKTLSDNVVTPEQFNALKSDVESQYRAAIVLLNSHANSLSKQRKWTIALGIFNTIVMIGALVSLLIH